MYSSSGTTFTLGYVDPMSPPTPAKIKIQLSGGTSSDPVATIMDTGTTGIVVGSTHFQPPPGQQSFGTGTYYDTEASSSARLRPATGSASMSAPPTRSIST